MLPPETAFVGGNRPISGPYPAVWASGLSSRHEVRDGDQHGEGRGDVEEERPAASLVAEPLAQGADQRDQAGPEDVEGRERHGPEGIATRDVVVGEEAGNDQP